MNSDSSVWSLVWGAGTCAATRSLGGRVCLATVRVPTGRPASAAGVGSPSAELRVSAGPAPSGRDPAPPPSTGPGWSLAVDVSAWPLPQPESPLLVSGKARPLVRATLTPPVMRGPCHHVRLHATVLAVWVWGDTSQVALAPAGHPLGPSPDSAPLVLAPVRRALSSAVLRKQAGLTRVSARPLSARLGLCRHDP